MEVMRLQTVDRDEREMYLYAVNYVTVGGRKWSFEYLAYDDEDAACRLRKIRNTEYEPEQIMERG